MKHSNILATSTAILPRNGHGSPLQCSCLENSMDRGAWWAAVHTDAWGPKELDTTERLSTSIAVSVQTLICQLVSSPGPPSHWRKEETEMEGRPLPAVPNSRRQGCPKPHKICKVSQSLSAAPQALGKTKVDLPRRQAMG